MVGLRLYVFMIAGNASVDEVAATKAPLLIKNDRRSILVPNDVDPEASLLNTERLNRRNEILDNEFQHIDSKKITLFKHAS